MPVDQPARNSRGNRREDIPSITAADTMPRFHPNSAMMGFISTEVENCRTVIADGQSEDRAELQSTSDF